MDSQAFDYVIAGGGSSAINAMLYIRGQRQGYDGWQVPGWGWDDVLPGCRQAIRCARISTPAIPMAWVCIM